MMSKEVKQEQDEADDLTIAYMAGLYDGKKQVKQEQDEPVAMRYDFDGYGYKYIDSGSGSDWQTREKGAEPLYTKPQTKEWVELTNEQIEEIWGNMPMMLNSHNNRTRIVFAKAIDAKLKERNT